jgi:hypothetical protein
MIIQEPFDRLPELRADVEPASHRQARLRDLSEERKRKNQNRAVTIWLLIFWPGMLFTNILSHGDPFVYGLKIAVLVGSIMGCLFLIVRYSFRRIRNSLGDLSPDETS